MKNINKQQQTIKLLDDIVYRKIAAGEVIDRPYSVLRELLDNSIDAQATEISIHIEEGGSGRIHVVDNGMGMAEQDLRLCYLPHATSKIRTEKDLEHITTLGFRGEALSSISTCSHLEIISKVADDKTPANRLLIQGGKLISLEKYMGQQGTVVDVSNLFYNLPARKKFLKRPATESTWCRNVFIDRAVAFPHIAFKFFMDGKLKQFLAPTEIIPRISAIFPSILQSDLMKYCEQHLPAQGLRLKLVLARPELNRKDRKYIQIFVNQRRVFEYSLVQAVEYGYSEYLPGGIYPYAFVFLEIDPQLVDFNIHPAKREVRFRNLGQIHKALTLLIKSNLSQYSLSMKSDFKKIKNSGNNITRGLKNNSFFPIPVEHDNNINPPLNKKYENFEAIGNKVVMRNYRYLGQILGVFLLAEFNNSLYIVDQHAAHERILFDELKQEKYSMQKLLFPIRFEASDDERDSLLETIPRLKELGINIKPAGNNNFEIESLAQDFLAIGEKNLVAFLKSQRGTLEEMKKEIHSITACRLAIKEGEVVDPLTACELLDRVFKLENARCPHGRPIYHKISKARLYELLARTGPVKN